LVLGLPLLSGISITSFSCFIFTENDFYRANEPVNFLAEKHTSSLLKTAVTIIAFFAGKLKKNVTKITILDLPFLNKVFKDGDIVIPAEAGIQGRMWGRDYRVKPSG
jgi:hypothetical protein